MFSARLSVCTSPKSSSNLNHIFQAALLSLLGVLVVVTAAPVGPVADSIFPISFVGNISPIQQTNFAGDTRIYMQRPDNSIIEVAVGGPLSVGHVFSVETLVDAADVQFQTLIAAVTLNPAAFQTEVHIFYISSNNTIAEVWTLNGVVMRGPTCSTCIDRQGFTVQPGNRVLYAMSTQAGESTGNVKLRVGFVSAGSPSTYIDRGGIQS
ncbi:hypothetical protein C8F01DRAFT_1090335 [Mycena amicta]|nr:hypothetical protein C8F01DRAFT_691849 [Mycena amicta]KAJ7052672.1 hypothetical protein C8F01DRAFT_1090335 [Mycena amicta]